MTAYGCIEIIDSRNATLQMKTTWWTFPSMPDPPQDWVCPMMSIIS